MRRETSTPETLLRPCSAALVTSPHCFVGLVVAARMATGSPRSALRSHQHKSSNLRRQRTELDWIPNGLRGWYVDREGVGGSVPDGNMASGIE